MGKVHKKKIAEYAEKSHNADLDEGDVEGDKQNGENDENTPRKNGVGRSAKKRSIDKNDSVSATSTGNAKKARKETKASLKAILPHSEEEGEEKKENGEPEEYEVEALIDHKIEDGVSYFLIRWKGYSSEDDTWEPEDTLSCKTLIAKFKKNDQAKKVASPKKKTPVKKNKSPPKKAGEKSPAKKSTESISTVEYEVEKILNYAEEKSGRKFLIRWKGYSSKYDTWEPEEHLNCDEKIQKFMQRMESQQNANFKELREEPKKTKRLANETLPRSHYTKTERASKRSSKKRVYYGETE